MKMTRGLSRVSCLAVLLGAGGLLSAPSAPAAPALTDEQALQEWFDQKQAYFDAHPELINEEGTGYNPYMRYRWFIEQRMLNGRLPAAGARWEAMLEKRERESQVTARSSWFSLGPTNFAGRMLAIDFDPTNASTVYVGGASGGVWKTTDAGTTWITTTDDLMSLAIGGLAVSKTNPNVVVIGTGEGTNNIDAVNGQGVLRSTDAGLTWETTDLTYGLLNGHGFHVVECSPNGTFLAGATDGLYRSTDDGATWTKVRNSDDWYDVKWKPGDPNTVYAAKGSAATGNNVKISTDDGVTWAAAGTGQPVSFQIGKTKLAVTAADPEVVYAAYASADGTAMTGIYRSTDGGANWTAQNTSAGLLGGQNWYNLVIVADPNDANKVILGGQPFVRSTNGGVSYSSIGGNVHVDFHAIAYEPGSDSNVWVGSDGGIWRSVNDGTSWTDMNNGIVTYQFYDICVNNGPDPYYVMGGTQDNGTDKWSGTTTWANGLGADGMVCNINPGNGTVVYAEIQSGGHRKNSTSGIGTWSTITSGLTGSSLWVAPVDESQQTGNTLFTSTSNGIFRTTNGGSSWQNVDGTSATWIGISPVDENIVWTVSGTPRYSTDGGNTWQFASAYGFGTGGARKIIGDPVDPNTVMVVFSAYSTSVSHVARSTDLGATWTDVSGDFPGVPANAIEINPQDTNEWFVGTDLGVWTSTNGGVNWLPMGTGLPNVVVDDLEIKTSLGKLVAGTHGRGAWEIDLASVGTDVNVAVDPADLKLMLDPPSPNPASDRTMLRYAAKHDGPVSLEIYDVQGRLVSDLQDFSRGDGVIRTTPWFTDDVVSGVYFAVLRAGDVRKTQKIIVAK